MPDTSDINTDLLLDLCVFPANTKILSWMQRQKLQKPAVKLVN